MKKRGVLALVFLMVMISPAAAKNKFEKEVEKEAGAVNLVREVASGGYGTVTTDELKQWIDSGKKMILVDTMPYESSYKKGHIPGARQFLFPIPAMTKWDPKETGGKTREDFEALLGPDKDKPVVIYCGFVKCTRSHNGAAWAKKLGYKNVYRHPGGIFAWKGAKYPVGKDDLSVEAICKRIGERAGNLFLTRQLWCSGAVLVVLNRVLDGDLTQDQAIRLAAGMGEGMGSAGCVCGGLNGGAMALGLFLGNGRLSPGGDQIVMKATRWLHDQFKDSHGSACCRILMKKDRAGSRTQFRACAGRTGKAAELTAMKILEHRPELTERVDRDYLNHEDGMVGARIKIIADKLKK